MWYLLSFVGLKKEGTKSDKTRYYMLLYNFLYRFSYFIIFHTIRSNTFWECIINSTNSICWWINKETKKMRIPEASHLNYWSTIQFWTLGAKAKFPLHKQFKNAWATNWDSLLTLRYLQHNAQLIQSNILSKNKNWEYGK